MKPTFTTYGHWQGRTYNPATGQYDPYYSREQYISRSQMASGVNNKTARPCSTYRAAYTLNGWVNTLTRYEKVNDIMIPTVIRDGPSVPINISPGLKTIQHGTLNEARSKMFGQALNLTMTAKDIIDANRMAVDYFKRVNKALPYLRKRKWADALKHFFGKKNSKSQAVANSWLEFQFGVLPTIQATQDAYNYVALSGKLQDYKLLRLRSASHNIEIQSEPEDDSGYTEIPTYHRVTKYSCYRYLAKRDFVTNLTRFNVIEVGWDATPWSFLVDWFVPVGDYLSQFGSITTFTTDGCDCTKREEAQYGAAKFLAPTVSGHQVRYVDRQSVDFTRQVNRTLSLNMTLSEMIQRSKLNLSCRRTVTAFALLRQRVGRK